MGGRTRPSQDDNTKPIGAINQVFNLLFSIVFRGKNHSPAQSPRDLIAEHAKNGE
jgi:hypothetical protein